MRHWPGPSMVQIMACHLLWYLNQCCIIVNWTLRNKLHSNHIRNSNIFIQENEFENDFWEMSAILSQPLCEWRYSWSISHRRCSNYISVIRGVTIRRATIRYVSRYVGRDTTNNTISDDTPGSKFYMLKNRGQNSTMLEKRGQYSTSDPKSRGQNST